MRALVAALPERFPNEKAALLSRFEAQFGRWWAQWCAGHSLLFYGYGSKRAMLQKFARQCTGDGACLIVDGLSPKISARQILAWAAGLAKFMRPQHFKNASAEEMLEAVSREGPRRKIYLILHNIDGPGKPMDSISSTVNLSNR
jgi:origin recognition complex subunit 2